MFVFSNQAIIIVFLYLEYDYILLLISSFTVNDRVFLLRTCIKDTFIVPLDFPKKDLVFFFVYSRMSGTRVAKLVKQYIAHVIGIKKKKMKAKTVALGYKVDLSQKENCPWRKKKILVLFVLFFSYATRECKLFSMLCLVITLGKDILYFINNPILFSGRNSIKSCGSSAQLVNVWC